MEPYIWMFAGDNVSILFVRVFPILVSDRFNVRKCLCEFRSSYKYIYVYYPKNHCKR